MAEGLFKHMTPGREGEFSASSAGVSAMDGYPASDETIRVMKEEGIDVSGHKSRKLTLAMARAADKIYVMEKMHQEMILHLCPESAGKVFLLAGVVSQGNGAAGDRDIPDPIQRPAFFYKNVLFIIRDCIGKIVTGL
jgi:protein-tyrosine phosphatase